MLPAKQVFEQTTPLDMSIGFKISARIAQDGHTELFYPVKRPMLPPPDFNLARVVETQDVLLSYPYQSIRPFIRMLNEAAQDPDVLSIKMTLYRVAHESKIIEALISAAENGKEVVAIVELRARFDEQNNIDFSKQLEEAGCTVIYGFEAYKIHSKLTLITKKRAISCTILPRSAQAITMKRPPSSIRTFRLSRPILASAPSWQPCSIILRSNA